MAIVGGKETNNITVLAPYANKDAKASTQMEDLEQVQEAEGGEDEVYFLSAFNLFPHLCPFSAFAFLSLSVSWGKTTKREQKSVTGLEASAPTQHSTDVDPVLRRPCITENNPLFLGFPCFSPCWVCIPSRSNPEEVRRLGASGGG